SILATVWERSRVSSCWALSGTRTSQPSGRSGPGGSSIVPQSIGGSGSRRSAASQARSGTAARGRQARPMSSRMLVRGWMRKAKLRRAIPSIDPSSRAPPAVGVRATPEAFSLGYRRGGASGLALLRPQPGRADTAGAGAGRRSVGPMDAPHLRLGRLGEAIAVRHLEGAGLEVVARNWRCSDPSLRGEIDLVARDGRVLVVCEVKTRRRAAPGEPLVAVT